MPRFNHMELTVPKGELGRSRAAISEFYRDLFGFESLDVEILKQTGLLFERLLTIDCRKELVEALKNEGRSALYSSNAALGRAASAELLHDPAVEAEAIKFTNYFCLCWRYFLQKSRSFLIAFKRPLEAKVYINSVNTDAFYLLFTFTYIIILTIPIRDKTNSAVGALIKLNDVDRNTANAGITSTSVNETVIPFSS